MAGLAVFAASAQIRLGLAASITPGYDNLTWYGLGPDENYADRKAAAWFGVFESTVKDMEEGYARSQTMGNRGEARWLSLTDDRGRGLKITAGSELGFSASMSGTGTWYTRSDITMI